MPSSATSFVIGMVTATAIAAGFAGVFMDNTARQQSTAVAMREPPKAATAAASAAPPNPAPAVAAPEPAAPQPASAPTTSGIAPPRQLPATQVTERSPTPALPSAAAVPVSKPADAGAADHPARPAEHVKKKHPRKDLAKRNKRKLEWYEDERAVAERQNYGSYGNRNRGLFGIFP